MSCDEKEITRQGLRDEVGIGRRAATARSFVQEGTRRTKIFGSNDQFLAETVASREILKSLKSRRFLQDKLKRVTNRIAKAKRALERKNLHASKSGFNRVPEVVCSGTECNLPLPSWRPPHLEDYTFKSPNVHMLISQGARANMRFQTQVRNSHKILNSPEAQQLLQISKKEHHHGVQKSDFSSFAEQKVLFDRMMKTPPVRSRT